MTRMIKLIVLMCCFSFQAFAVDPSFVVFYNSGKAVKIVKGKAITLKKGDQLMTTDSVSVPEKTQLVLVCANYSVVQLKGKVGHRIKKLLADCSVKSTSASSAYFKYVWNQFSHKHKKPDADPLHYMETYGAASRGKGVKTKVNTDIIYYYDGKLSIGWEPTRPLNMVVYDTNADKNILITGKMAHHAPIDSIASLLKKPGSYFWDFEGAQSEKFKLLKILPKKQYDQLKTAILNNVVVTTPAETAYLSAYLLEEKHFLAEAAKYYQKALQLNPTNKIYAAACERFKP